MGIIIGARCWRTPPRNNEALRVATATGPSVAPTPGTDEGEAGTIAGNIGIQGECPSLGLSVGTSAAKVAVA